MRCGDPTWMAQNFGFLEMSNFDIYVVHSAFGAILGDPKFGWLTLVVNLQQWTLFTFKQYCLEGILAKESSPTTKDFLLWRDLHKTNTMCTRGTRNMCREVTGFKPLSRALFAGVCWYWLIATCKRIAQGTAYNEFGYNEHLAITNRKFLTAMFNKYPLTTIFFSSSSYSLKAGPGDCTCEMKDAWSLSMDKPLQT